MKARWRVLVAALAALAAAGSPASAQEEPAQAPAQAPARNDSIGPPQLKDFSINGTVTREAPAPVRVQPKPRPAPAPAVTSSTPTARSSRSEPASAARTESAAQERRAPARSEPQAKPADLPAPAESTVADSRPAPSEDSIAAPPTGLAPAPAAQPLDAPHGGFPLLPWLAAALALAGAVAWFFLRQRPRESLAGGVRVDSFDLQSAQPQSPAPAPPPRAPQHAPVAPPPSSTGIVSTRLRPWLEIQFKPLRAVVDEEKAALAFELSVFNSGNTPAQDVLIEASLFNAGPMQDQQIQLFFDNPVAKGDRLPLIGPTQKITVNTAVFLARKDVRPIEIEGRPLFVPMIAFNVLYGWGRGAGQTSASYLVGKSTTSDKLAPFRLDLGPRIARHLAALEHELRLRK
jgi:hypothetical protein